MVIKKIIGWALSWCLYFIGHMTSLTFRWDDVAGKTYPYYNWFMLKAYDIQEWAKCRGPWKEIEDDEEDDE